MNHTEIEQFLARAEDVLAEGRSLKGTGFWPAVEAVKRDPVLIARYADRIAAIDRRAFEQGVKLRLPAAFGAVALVLMTAIGVMAVVMAKKAGARVPTFGYLQSGASIDAYHWPGFVPVAFLVGFGSLLIGTHSLTHWIIGRLVGIRFTHVFLGGPPPPRPGFKTDYETYLRTSPRKRALMHASGAIVTKMVPFALLPVSLSFYTSWPWLMWILLAIGVVQIVTDVFLSTKVSDWKKVLRELRAARG
jgi:hypothetical protein